MDTEPSSYDGSSSFRSMARRSRRTTSSSQAMAREEDMTDQQFDEICRQFAPVRLPRRRRSEPAAAVVRPTTILEISFVDGFPVFSDGNHSIAPADDGRDNEMTNNHIAVDNAYPDGGIGAVPACGVAVTKLPEAVAGEATREEQCAVCMDAFVAGQKLRMPCPSSHRFHESCIFRWLAVSRVCPVCRFALPPAVEETDEDSRTDTAAEETGTGSGGETDAYTTEETDSGSDAEAERDGH